jgi:hypothetical protein
MLEVMYPAEWLRRDDFECFAVSEPQTGDLHTWCARVGWETDQPEYWEMIAPIGCTTGDIWSRIEIAMKAEKEMV